MRTPATGSRGQQRPQGSRQPRMSTSISTRERIGVPGSRYASSQHAILNGESALIAVWEPFTYWPRIVHLADTPKNQYEVHRTAVVIPRCIGPNLRWAFHCLPKGCSHAVQNS